MKKYLITAFAFIFVLGLVGCNDNDQNATGGDVQNVDYTPDKSPAEMWNNIGTMSEEDKQLAQKCADIAASQENVRTAQTYAMGETVYVALRVADNVNDEKVIDDVRKELESQTDDVNFNIVSDYGAFEQMKKSTKAVRGNNENIPAGPGATPEAPGTTPTAPGTMPAK